ncbi:hypothetical protein M3Y97_01029400 [Aphelenchoides bicaudatus]|nr:hypothetical protein M3Y97_01029400 [Aphelenchoides bicaudatus]
MDRTKAGERLEWLPGMPNMEMMFGLSQEDLDVFFEFVAQVDDVAKSFRKRYSKLPRNGTSPIILKKPTTTTPAPPSKSSFPAATFVVILLLLLAVAASAGGYFLWKRYKGQNRSIIDFLPLIRNGAGAGSENDQS